ncbi:F0F1 ATP synthase subunit B [Candidatus Saccharibacteria bacterium]|nr:F0F1 ATP synthase subunit B [Candidatus Saccharibacteria bacterium]
MTQYINQKLSLAEASDTHNSASSENSAVHDAPTATKADAETHTSTQAHTGEDTHAAESGILGVNGGAFVIQIVTFLFVFAILKKFAFNKIVKLLDERHKTINSGVRMGLEMEKEKLKFEEELAKTMRDARHEADEIIAAANKDARAAVREAEISGQKKADAILVDAELRAAEESKQARLKLEKDIVGLVGEATEVIVGDKVDSVKDTEIIRKAMKGKK